MPPRKRATFKRTRTQNGKGFGDIWRAIKSAAPAVHRFVKDNKLISRGLALTPYKGAAAAAAQLGYGSGKRRKRATTATARRRELVNALSAVTSLPKARRTRRVRSGVSVRRATLVPRTSRRRAVFLSAPVQNGTGIFSDIGSGLGSFAHGIFG